DILKGATIATREEKPVFQHPMIEHLVFVTTNRALQMAAKGLNTATFGNVSIDVFETLDEALAFARHDAA
ncbi:MAG: hypothetical protein AAF653_21065, partial [Chloroflexota bacterium]